MIDVNDTGLTPAERAERLEQEAGGLLAAEHPTLFGIRTAHAAAALALSLRVRGCEEMLDSIRLEGMVVR